MNDQGRRFAWRLLAALAVTLSASGAAVAARIVLPTDVVPEHYRIEITPDAKALTFTGHVAIDVDVRRPTRTVVLNAADLVVDQASLSGETGAPVIAYDEKIQTASFTFGAPVTPGHHVLSLAYHGKIYQQASGFFALDYVTPQGQKRGLFTQFENSDARRFIPCWDEPGLKATFQLTVVAPADEMAVSNMPAASRTSLAGGLERVAFAQTPRMSSYLLFLGLGDFERIHRMVDGVDVGVVVKRGDTDKAKYALDAAAQILPYYNSYFGTPFPLPKLDLIAGPGQSQFFGAMENWGAIFSFERDLLVDPALSTEDDKQNVYIVTAHEMSHQWFGDLVTMAWWNDLWLNEGFASWMENKVTDHFHPEWQVWLQSMSAKQSVMQTDARGGTHPIITPIDDVLQAAGAFDDITYSKGQAVIRMLEAHVGEDAWRDGVRRYMRDHAYSNTVTDDLWAEMDKGSSTPIAQIAHDFTLQAGVPLITEDRAACEGGGTSLVLSQSHFAIDPESTSATLWRVPVTAAILGGAGRTEAVVSGHEPTPLRLTGCGAAIINAGQTGYFRTAYSPEGLAGVVAQLPKLGPYDQLGVYNDTATLAYVGREPMAAFLDMTSGFEGFAADPVVMSEVARFRSFAREVLQPTYARLGWSKQPGESDNTAGLRSAVLAALGDFGDAAVLAEARRRFAAMVADPSSVDPTTRRTVLVIVAEQADAATWDQIHALAKAATSQLARREYYTLLGLAEDPALAKKALDLSFSGEPDPTTAPGIVAAVSRRHPEMAFDFAVSRWDLISRFLEPTTLAAAIPRLVSQASDPALIPKLDAFAAAHIPAGARQDVLKAEATMRYLGQVRTQRLPEVDRWLAGRHG
jgi:aminopeptidase N